MEAVLLDAHAVLVYLQDEPGAERVEELLLEAERGQVRLCMQKINLGEVYYPLMRRMGQEEADRFLETFRQLPVEILDPADELIWSASRIKAAHPISLGDCFAVATARREGAMVLTGDPEFEKVGDLVRIEWL